MQNTQQIPLQEDAHSVSTSVEMSAKKFSDFRSFLNVIKSDFNDFSLVRGVFRSRSNSRTSIVETGLPLFSDMNFTIFKIKE